METCSESILCTAITQIQIFKTMRVLKHLDQAHDAKWTSAARNQTTYLAIRRPQWVGNS